MTVTARQMFDIIEEILEKERGKNTHTHGILTEQPQTKTGTLPEGNRSKNKKAYTTQNKWKIPKKGSNVKTIDATP